MAGRLPGTVNDSFEEDGVPMEYLAPRSRNGTLEKDDDERSEKSRRVVHILDVNGLLVNQLGPGIDEAEGRVRSYRGTPKILRSRRSSLAPSAIDDCFVGDILNEEDGKKDKADDVDAESNNSLFSRRMTIAGGFLDVALFTSNCEQIKSILEIREVHMHYELVLGLLIASMILQAVCGITLFMVGCIVIRNPTDKKRVDILNHFTIGIIVLITAINIFISSFTVKGEVLHRCYNCLQALTTNEGA